MADGRYSGAERRQHARANVHLEAEITSPESPFFYTGQIVDLSAGGMRLHLPRNVEKHILDSPFYVGWTMAGHTVRALVYRLYHFSPNEIAVRYMDQASVLTSEISRYVFIVLRTEQIRAQALRAKELGVSDEGEAASRRERRSQAMKSHKGLSDALVDSVNLHKDRTGRWLGRRIATHLD